MEGLAAARERLKKIYDKSQIADVGHALVDQLSSYYARMQEEPSGLPWTEPQNLVLKAEQILNSKNNNIRNLADTFLHTNNRLHSPHYMGHQVAASIPLAGLFEMLGATTNQASGLYEMGPLPSAVDRALSNKMGQMIGWKDGTFDSISTHGGSLANLTALLAARNHHYPQFWKKGFASVNGIPTIAVSRDAHYSIKRAAGILGLGEDAVLALPLDEKRRVDIQKSKAVMSDAKAKGRDIFCVIASSGSTPFGAFDSVGEMAELARSFKAWLHVDGAHGMGLLFSETHREKLRGIEKADSITWDAHKMMFVPALCTFVFYRDKAMGLKAFQQDAPYLFDANNPTAEFDSATRAFECTKRSLTMGLWATWSMYGAQVFGDLVDVTCGTAQRFFEILSASDDFKPLHRPESNILCFRYLPLPNSSQKKLRRRVIEGGKFYLTSTVLDGEECLRVVVMNPLIEEKHLLGLLDEIRAQSRSESPR